MPLEYVYVILMADYEKDERFCKDQPPRQPIKFLADSKNFISNCVSVIVMKSPSPANSCQLKVLSTNSENSFERNGRYMDFSL